MYVKITGNPAAVYYYLIIYIYAQLQHGFVQCIKHKDIYIYCTYLPTLRRREHN